MLESIKAVAAIEVPPRYQPRSAKRRCVAPCAHLLRSSGRAARRRDHGRAGRYGLSRAQRRRRRGDAGRRHFLDDFGVDLTRGAAIAPSFLPALSRLERAPLSRRRPRRREILRRCVDLGWLTRARDHRAVTITPIGRAGLLATFGIGFESGESAEDPGGVDAKRAALRPPFPVSTHATKRNAYAGSATLSRSLATTVARYG